MATGVNNAARAANIIAHNAIKNTSKKNQKTMGSTTYFQPRVRKYKIPTITDIKNGKKTTNRAGRFD